jgi:hypothetical protein
MATSARDTKSATTSQVFTNVALWIAAILIVALSVLELFAGRSIASLGLGFAAALLVMPPIRSRMHRGIRYFLTPKVTTGVVAVILTVQLIFMGMGVTIQSAKQEAAEKQRIHDLGVARRQALADAFNSNKASILSAIQQQVSAGNLQEALAEASKYDNPDADLEALRHSISVSLLKSNLKDEANMSLASRAATYTKLAALEPGQAAYATKADGLNAELAKEQKLAAEKAANHAALMSQFSQWDGSHRQVEAAIKARMNDPDSYTHVETRFKETDTGAIIVTKFRGKNGFGGVITQTATALVDHDGTVTSLVF